jgi:hypothetical protein
MFADATKFIVGNSIPSTHHDPKRSQLDAIVRNGFETNDLEARRRENDLSAEKKTAHDHNHGHRGRTPHLNQPKPKFVSHKAPHKSKGHKDKKGSNRLGEQLHMA